MNFDKVRSLVDDMERQPENKEGYLEKLKIIKQISEMTAQEDKEAYNEIEKVEAKLTNVKREIESFDIIPQAYKELEEGLKLELESLRKLREHMEGMNSILGQALIEISDNLEDDITAPELAEIIDCPVSRVEEAKENYKQSERKEKISFIHYAIDFENVEGERGADWKEGLLFTVLTDMMMNFLTKTKEGKEAGQKLINHLVYEEGLTTYKKNEAGELVEDYPKLKLID